MTSHMAMYIVFEVHLSDTKNEEKWKKCIFFILARFSVELITQISLVCHEMHNSVNGNELKWIQMNGKSSKCMPVVGMGFVAVGSANLEQVVVDVLKTDI